VWRDVSAYPGEVATGSPIKDMRQRLNPERIPIPKERDALWRIGPSDAGITGTESFSACFAGAHRD
jgi:hypothetical protein